MYASPELEDELTLLKKRYRLMEQGIMTQSDFAFAYQHAALGTRMAFDGWRSRELAYGSTHIRPVNPLLAPTPFVGLVPVVLQDYGVRRELTPPPPVYRPTRVPSQRPTPPPASPEVGKCSGCNIALSFEPPRSQSPIAVQCPRCMATSKFQVCWTCPAVIPFDSMCRRCYENDKKQSFQRLPTASISSEVNSNYNMTNSTATYEMDAVAHVPSRSGSAPATSPRSVPEEKGLTNRAGDNHCFLNVTIQSLWHLKPFRDHFEAHPVQHPSHCACVYCALTLILTNYRFAASDTLAPDVLRRSLDLLYSKESKFQLGELSDATECFDAICTNLHQEAGGQADKTCDPLCSAHASFRLLVEDRCVCKKCGSVNSDVQSMFLHYVYASEIIKRFTKATVRSSKKTFDKILRKLNSVEPRRCAKCDSIVPVQRILLKPWPKIFALCVAWADANPPPSDVANVLAAVEQELDISVVFEQASSFVDRGKRYKLRGVICYYLKHYAAYFFNDKEGVWFSFDDVSVHEVGPSWRDVMRKCRMGHQKPVLLFYEEVVNDQSEVDSPVIAARHRSIRDRFMAHHN